MIFLHVEIYPYPLSRLYGIGCQFSKIFPLESGNFLVQIFLFKESAQQGHAESHYNEHDYTE